MTSKTQNILLDALSSASPQELANFFAPMVKRFAEVVDATLIPQAVHKATQVKKGTNRCRPGIRTNTTANNLGMAKVKLNPVETAMLSLGGRRATATLTGVSYKSARMWGKAGRVPRFNIAKKISRATGVPVHQLHNSGDFSSEGIPGVSSTSAISPLNTGSYNMTGNPTPDEMIQFYGGASKMAQATGVPLVTIYRWKGTGQLPTYRGSRQVRKAVAHYRSLTQAAKSL